jgi:hypothetical protein
MWPGKQQKPIKVSRFSNMKHLFLLLSAMVCLNASAQKPAKKTELFAALDVNQFQSIGGSFSFHPLITSSFSVGAGLDLVQIRDNNYNYTPYYFDTRYFIRGKKLTFFLFVQGSPGSLGKDRQKAPFSSTVLSERVNRSFLGMGSGIALGPQSAKTKPYVLTKFRRYQMLEREVFPSANITGKYALDQYSVSVGINF